MDRSLTVPCQFPLSTWLSTWCCECLIHFLKFNCKPAHSIQIHSTIPANPFPHPIILSINKALSFYEDKTLFQPAAWDRIYYGPGHINPNKSNLNSDQLCRPAAGNYGRQLGRHCPRLVDRRRRPSWPSTRPGSAPTARISPASLSAITIAHGGALSNMQTALLQSKDTQNPKPKCNRPSFSFHRFKKLSYLLISKPNSLPLCNRTDSTFYVRDVRNDLIADISAVLWLQKKKYIDKWIKCEEKKELKKTSISFSVNEIDGVLVQSFWSDSRQSTFQHPICWEQFSNYQQ